MVEFGRDRDLDPYGQASRQLFGSDKAVSDSQACLEGMADRITHLKAISTRLPGEGGKDRYLYRLVTKMGTTVVGHFSETVGFDLFGIGKSLDCGSLRPPDEINHLHSIDVRSLVLSPDDPALSQLRKPFCDSGIMLAPVVFSFPTLYLKWYKSRFH